MEGDQLEPKSFEQIAREASMRLTRKSTLMDAKSSVHEEELHPRYDEDKDNAFIRELYRLKGFAYLRN